MLIFLCFLHSVTVDTLCSFLLQSVHLYFHYLQCVERFSFVFISVPSAFLSSSLPPPSLALLACLLLFIWVHLLSFPPLWFPDIAPCSLLFYRVCPPHPPAQSSLLSVSSSKWVFGCQCQSVGGGDELVALTVSLAMTIISWLPHLGGTHFALLICPHYMSQQFNIIGDDLSVSKCLLISACLTFLLCHIHTLRKVHQYLLSLSKSVTPFC